MKGVSERLTSTPGYFIFVPLKVGANGRLSGLHVLAGTDPNLFDAVCIELDIHTRDQSDVVGIKEVWRRERDDAILLLQFEAVMLERR